LSEMSLQRLASVPEATSRWRSRVTAASLHGGCCRQGSCVLLHALLGCPSVPWPLHAEATMRQCWETLGASLHGARTSTARSDTETLFRSTQQMPCRALSQPLPQSASLPSVQGTRTLLRSQTRARCTCGGQPTAGRSALSRRTPSPLRACWRALMGGLCSQRASFAEADTPLWCHGAATTAGCSCSARWTLARSALATQTSQARPQSRGRCFCPAPAVGWSR